MKHFYSVLEVDENATQDQIKKAYRKLAMKSHPDKGGSQEVFKEINEAYSILSDPQKRSAYDAGQLDNNGNMNAPNFDPFNVFSNFFNDNNRHFQRPQTRQPQAKQVSLRVTLEDLYKGKETHLKISRQGCCQKCNGVGGTCPPTKCNDCDGSGKIRRVLQLGPGMMQHSIGQCPSCKGNGVCIDNQYLCDLCNGNKTIEEITQITIHINKGASHNDKIVLKKYGDYNLQTHTYNDLILVIEEKTHNRIKRNGNNLYIEHTINLRDSLTGTNVDFNHLDDNLYTFKIDEVIVPDSLYKINSLGMIHKHIVGDLFIKFNILFPDHIIENTDISFNECFPQRKTHISNGILKYPIKTTHTEDTSENDNNGSFHSAQQCAQQ